MRRISPFIPLLLAVQTALANAPTSEQDADRAELMSLKEAYEQAVYQNKPELLTPYLDEKFECGALLMRVKSRQDFVKLWNKIIETFVKGKGTRGYKFRIKPDTIEVNGDMATAKGVTEESIDETPIGPIRYSTAWEAKLAKKDGKWKLTSMDAQFNPAEKISKGLTAAVSGIWSSLLRPKLSLYQPDYDGGGTRFIFKNHD